MHGVQEQLKLLQGLGSLLRHQISAIHNETTSGADASVLCTVYYYTHIHELSKIPFTICHMHGIQRFKRTKIQDLRFIVC